MSEGSGVLRGLTPRSGRALAAVAGLALPLAFAPFGWYPLAVPLLALVFWLWEATPGEAAWRGFWFGTAAFAAGTWWLYNSVRVIGGTPLPVAVLLLGGLVLIMALYYTLAGWLVARLRAASPAVHRALVAPAVWVLLEWLRGWFLSGFPWLTVGYAGIEGPLAAWAPVAGVYGLSLVTAVLAGLLLEVLLGPMRRRLVAAGAGAALALATWGLSGVAWTAPDGHSLRVALVQGAIPQSIKWQPEEQAATLVRYQMMTLELRTSELVIWPEAAIPVPSDEVPEFLQNMGALARARHQQLFTGVLTHEPDTDVYRNTLLALGEPAGAYHKRHLVPFGEYFPVPRFVRAWMRMMNLPYDDITAGSPRQEPLVAGNVRFAPTICYEDVFGAEQLGFLPAAGVLVNVSNDAWFGDTMAPHQHLQMARMRALETGRWLLRSTNTGITAVIDDHGRVVRQARQFEPAVLTANVRSYAGATPYVRTGDYPVLVLCLAAWGGALLRGNRGQTAIS